MTDVREPQRLRALAAFALALWLVGVIIVIASIVRGQQIAHAGSDQDFSGLAVVLIPLAWSPWFGAAFLLGAALATFRARRRPRPGRLSVLALALNWVFAAASAYPFVLWLTVLKGGH
jgi:uncharacterized BrkB/YihY/UPF0761 family membrane protein